MEREDRIAQICAQHKGREGPLLLILHDVHAEFGCIDESAVRTIASQLNLTRAEVHGVVSFYHDFETEADARPHIQICRAEACKARGVEALVAGAQEAAGERVRLSTVYCLGLCSAGPAARVDDTMHARLDAERLKQLIENVR